MQLGVNMHAIRSDIYYEDHMIADVPVSSYWICKLASNTSFQAKEILSLIKNLSFM